MRDDHRTTIAGVGASVVFPAFNLGLIYLLRDVPVSPFPFLRSLPEAIFWLVGLIFSVAAFLYLTFGWLFCVWLIARLLGDRDDRILD